MNCISCSNFVCCPEHCCDWDSCRCQDCENCGGTVKNKRENTRPAEILSSSQDLVRADLKKTQKNRENSIHDTISMVVKQNIEEERAREPERKTRLEASNMLERERASHLIASSKATIEKNREVLESTSETISRIESMLKDLKSTEKKFQDFQDAFDKAMSESISRCFGGLELLGDFKEKYGQSKKSTSQEVAEILARASRVGIITGAGVSAESGVFTYKNNEETYKIGSKELKLQEVMNINVFLSFPLEFWQNIQFNRSRFSACEANLVHRSLAEFLKFFRKNGRKVSLVTQNIDGFDREILGNDEDLYEIHGNISEMRCMQECGDELTSCSMLESKISQIPLCRKCGNYMRPNVLLYGEDYTEKWYRAETAATVLKNAEVLVVIGTQVKCGVSDKVVKGFVTEGKTIVEINVEPVIPGANTFFLQEPCGQVFPGIVKEVERAVESQKKLCEIEKTKKNSLDRDRPAPQKNGKKKAEPKLPYKNTKILKKPNT